MGQNSGQPNPSPNTRYNNILFSFIEQSTPPPVERNLPIRRDDNRSSSEKPSIADFSHAAATILKEKSPVPNKRKTPPPPARKNSSPGRSLIPKRTSSAGAEESKKSFSSGSTR